MFVSEDLTVNEKNHLVIGKNDTVELATDLSFMQTRLSAHFSLADLLKKKVWVLTLYRAASFIRR